MTNNKANFTENRDNNGGDCEKETPQTPEKPKVIHVCARMYNKIPENYLPISTKFADVKKKKKDNKASRLILGILDASHTCPVVDLPREDLLGLAQRGLLAGLGDDGGQADAPKEDHARVLGGGSKHGRGKETSNLSSGLPGG